MAEKKETVKETVTADQVVNNTKKSRRGIGSAKGTIQKKFHESDADGRFGLFMGTLKEVTVSWATIDANSTGLASFAGESIPRLNFHFTSLHASESDRRHVYSSFIPVESNTDTIPGGNRAWAVDQIFNYIKHYIDVYLKRELTAEEEDALALSFEDFDENGEFITVDAKDVIASYASIFTKVASIFNGGETGKPIFLDASGKHVKIWMKLLRSNKSKNVWKVVGRNGDLSFPSFVGEGVIEIVKDNVAPNIKLDLSKESLTLKEDKAKAPNMPGMPGASAGAPIDPSFAGTQFAGGGFAGGFIPAAGSEDLPF